MNSRISKMMGAAVLAAVALLSVRADDPLRKPIPPARELPRIGTTELRDPSWRFRFVRLRGTLQDVFPDEIDARYAFGLLFVGDMPIYVSFRDVSIGRLEALVGAEIDLAAYIDRYVPRSGRRILGARLGVSGQWKDAIEVVRPAPADPFAVPDISNIGPNDVDRLPRLGRRSVTGEVLALWGGTTALVRRTDDGSCLNVSFRDSKLPTVGETIEAVGLPEMDFFRINLVRAIWRPTDRAAFVPSDEELIDLANDAVAPGGELTNHGSLVRLRGRVISVPGPTEERRQVVVESAGRKIEVDVSAQSVLPDGLEPGSSVEITGRLIHEVTISNTAIPFAHVTGCFLVPRTTDDFVVTARPPWWTPGRLFAVILALLVIVVAVLVWVWALGQVAERRGRELYRRRIESARDAIKGIERKRLSVELHDSLAQSLSGVAMELEAAQQFPGGADERLVLHLSIAGRILDASRRELKNCLWDLRSDAIGEPDMNAAVRKTLLPHCRNVELIVRFNVSCSRLDSKLAYDILRIVRELVLNAIRHGGARHLEIAGCIDAGQLLFSVKDDGRGFDPDSAPGVLQGHFGIRGIRERLKGRGGVLDYERLAHGMYARVSLKLETNGRKGAFA